MTINRAHAIRRASHGGLATPIDWNKSHKLIDHESSKDCAWVHAYLHRVEGDLWNARYWYRRSGKPESKLSLAEERQQITQALLEQF